MRRLVPLFLFSIPAVFGAFLASPATAQPDLAPTSITLEEPGDEPRRELRYAPEKDLVDRASMTMDMKQNMELAGRPPFAYVSPRTLMEMTFEVEDGDDDTFALAWEITSAEAQMIDGVMPQVLTAVRPVIASAVGVSGVYVLSPLGVASGGEVNVPAGVAPEMADSMQMMNENFERLAIPLPEEPVGVGAKWTVESQSQVQGMVMTQRVSTTLRSIEGDRVECYVQIRQTAEGGQVMEDVPGQYVNTLESMTGRGSGTLILDLGRVVPILSNVVNSNDLVFTTTLPTGESMTQSIETTMSMSLRSLEETGE